MVTIKNTYTVGITRQTDFTVMANPRNVLLNTGLLELPHIFRHAYGPLRPCLGFVWTLFDTYLLVNT
jgi:hypothetical protein